MISGILPDYGIVIAEMHEFLPHSGFSASKKLRFYEGEVCYIARLETVDCE